MATLYVIATPIGNLEDITVRALKVLGEIDALACEDTRQTRKIYTRYNIAVPRIVFSYHEYNEERAGQRILGLLKQDLAVGLCTNAGYPSISDPGYRIVSGAVAEGFDIVVVPGAGAVTTALVAAGLATSSYTFRGFLPKKRGQRKAALMLEKESPHTMVIFESPYRVVQLLEDAQETLGDRKAAVCIELTKRFESTYRGYLSELRAQLQERVPLKGEITVVVAGSNPKFLKPTERPPVILRTAPG